MKRRNLLLVTYHFPPSAAIASLRFLGAARHLAAHGWRLVVVSPPTMPWEPVDPKLAEQIPADVPVYRVPYPQGRLWKPLRYLAPNGCWLPFARAGVRRAVRDYPPDAVWTSGPPHSVHLMGRWVQRQFGIPWVAGFRDPWVACNWLRASLPPVKRWEVAAEASVIAHADAILTISPRFQHAMQAAFPAYAAKFHVIPNGFEPGDYPAAKAPPLADPDAIEVLHTGTIYANRNPALFLNSVGDLGPEHLPGSRSLRVRLVGPVQEQQAELAQAAARWSPPGRVRVEPQIPHAEALRAMVGADVLLLLDSPGRHIGVPAKLYEYLGAGRPILALAEPDSDVGWVLSQGGVPYRIAPPDNPGAIRAALLELLQELASRRQPTRAARGPQRFTRDHLAGELAQLLDGLVPPPRTNHLSGSREFSTVGGAP